jgi:hypothetical protein
MAPPATPELKMILDRLEKVERQNRDLRRTCVAGFCLLGCLIFLGQPRLAQRVERVASLLKESRGMVSAQLNGVSEGKAESGPRALRRPDENAWILPSRGEPAPTEAGLLILNSLHPLIPTLAGVGETAREMIQQMKRQFEPFASPAVSRKGDEGAKPVLPAALPPGPMTAGDPKFVFSWSEAPARLPLVTWNRPAVVPRGEALLVPRPIQLTNPSAAGSRSIPTSAGVSTALPGSTPVAPPVGLKALGYAESAGAVPQAILTDDINIYVVRLGETFAGRFRLLSVGPTEVAIDDRLGHRTLRLPFNP